MNRVWNFAPGPSMLADEVLKQVQKDLLCYGSTGMSVMEMSHRSKMYLEIFDKAAADFRDVMGVPEGWTNQGESSPAPQAQFPPKHTRPGNRASRPWVTP